MSAPVWRAVTELATVWRSSAYVQDYLTGVGGPLEMCGSSGHHIAAQPLYMWKYLPTHMSYNQFARSTGASAWLEKCAHLGHAYTTMIEWLRSRLRGYPFPGAPQLTPVSPWTTFNVSMQVPWLIKVRRWQLQNKATPPTIPFLDVDAAAQLKTGARLGAAVGSSPAASELAAAWQSLTEADKNELHSACAAVAQARYPEPADVTGTDDFRELNWAQTALDEAVRPLTGRAKAFADALTSADGLIQQAAFLFSQLVVHNQVRQLGHVTLVEQLDGAGGWHTVRSDSHFLGESVRNFEILEFDHPYPRGMMLVAGIEEEFGPHHGAVTVYGRILPDSEELGASAIPMRAIHTAPRGPSRP